MPQDPQTFKRAVIANTLRDCEIFSTLPASDLENIVLFCSLKNLAKGELLFVEGDPSEGFYVVQRGAIDIHRMNAAGKEQTVHIFRAGQSFAEAALTTPQGYPANARALEESAVILIPKIDFIDLLSRQPDMALRMLGSMSQHLRVLVGLLDDLTLKDMETRLANWLLKRCPLPLNDTPSTIELESTKRVLASELGTTSETLSRTFAKFRDRNLIRVSGSVITVTDPRELGALLRRNLSEA